MVDEEILMKALRDVREASGLTQIQFSVRIGKSYASVQRYEGTTPPKGKELIPFVELAREYKRYDLAKIIKQAAIESVPTEIMKLIQERGPEDEFNPQKETANESARHKRRVRA